MALRNAWVGLLLAVLASGCVAIPESIRIEGIKPIVDTRFTLVDARSMENISGGRRESDHTVWWVYGDVQISPPPLVLLRTNLGRTLNQALAGKVIKVEKFEVSVMRLKSASQRGSVPVPSSGSVGADILGGLLGGMLIDAIEDAKSSPTITTEIVIDIGGKKAEYAEMGFKVSSELDQRLAENMTKAVAGLIGKIDEMLKPAPKAATAGEVAAQ